MPPRPAPGSARRGSSQRQETDEEGAVKALERLAAAADLEAFAVQQEEEICLLGLGAALWSSLLSATAAGSPGHALLAAWMAAVARGMQLAAQQLDISSRKQHGQLVSLLCSLVGPISNCFFIITTPGPAGGSGDDLNDRVRVALSVLAARSGVVKAHEQLSLRLTSIISDQQAASSSAVAAQQQQTAPEMAKLVSRHLNLFLHMAQAWPGGDSAPFSPSLCQAVPAAAGLTATVLRSRQTQPADGITVWRAASPLHVILLLCDAFDAVGSSVPEQIAGSSSVGTLLLMALGLAAQGLHQLQRGLSPAAVGAASGRVAAGASGAQQQRLAVPAYHTQLLQALGVAAGSAGLDDTRPQAFWGEMIRSLVATDAKRQRLADEAEAASCQQALLLVLLECALLDPTAPLVESVSMTLRRPLANCYHMAWQLGSALLRAILEQDACRRALEATPAAASLAAAASGGAAGNLSVLEVLARLTSDINLYLLSWQVAINIADDDEALFDRMLAGVAAVWLEHPAQHTSLLEAGLRFQPNDTYALQPPACTAYAVGAAARARHSTGGGAMTADSQQRVFALLLSCLKTAAAATEQGRGSITKGTGVSDTAPAMEILGSAGGVLVNVIRACAWLLEPTSSTSTTSSGSSSSTSSASTSSASTSFTSNSRSSSSSSSSQTTSMAAPAAAAGFNAQLGCVLLARCLVTAGRIVQRLARAPTRDGRSRQQLLLESGLLGACEFAATLLVQQLPEPTAAAAEPWLQQLLEEHALLEQQLQSLLAQMAAATGKGCSPADGPPPLPALTLAGVAEQLQAFGAGVCAALPVQQCCNHPDCRNLEQASELQLVGGKSCVCGGCRVARYCSRECQVAHYKGWHKAVCKRLQQR